MRPFQRFLRRTKSIAGIAVLLLIGFALLLVLGSGNATVFRTLFAALHESPPDILIHSPDGQRVFGLGLLFLVFIAAIAAYAIADYRKLNNKYASTRAGSKRDIALKRMRKGLRRIAIAFCVAALLPLWALVPHTVVAPAHLIKVDLTGRVTRVDFEHVTRVDFLYRRGNPALRGSRSNNSLRLWTASQDTTCITTTAGVSALILRALPSTTECRANGDFLFSRAGIIAGQTPQERVRTALLRGPVFAVPPACAWLTDPGITPLRTDR